MNKYSWLQRQLHGVALSKQFIRETFFDLEKFFISGSRVIDSGNHVFIAGMARSGTTVLLNSIYNSKIFASLTYEDMPFVLSPSLWSRLSGKKRHSKFQERAHGDGIMISTNSPEAFEEVFWKTFEYDEDVSNLNFMSFVKSVLHRNKKERYLSKNNQNFNRLSQLYSIYPDSKFLILFRDPIQCAFSLRAQHLRFYKFAETDKFIAKYMKWIGHFEFGPHYTPHVQEYKKRNLYSLDHWLEQWFLSYSRILAELKNKNNFFFVSYEKLCSSSKVWKKIKNVLEIDEGLSADFKESHANIAENYDQKLLSDCQLVHEQLLSKCL